MSDQTPSEITLPASPLDNPHPDREKGERFKEYQLETIAKLSCMNANSPEQIAITCGTSTKSIMRLLSGSNKTFNKLRDRYQQLVMQHHTGAMMNMIEMLPDCNQAIQNALQSGDVRVAKDTAFEIYDRVLPEMGGRGRSDGESGGINISITNNPQAVTLLNETVESVGTMLIDLKSHLSEGDEGRVNHELIGEQALPVPPGQLEVGSGEPLPAIEDSEDWLELIELPDEKP